ncbi:hypothetical protein [Desulfitobacterium sp.]|uniref:hypothetical protein n=1 Tax=Desulfitobacterium sp. TaxID=49981 RepID=UPI002C775909|nr:hypothetical protein [Desulfitobacterium sp.]HVJ48279.1 hypothetical protein [Desulfitobacterium sp.]
MKQHFWVVSALLTSLFLSGCAPSTSVLTSAHSLQAAQTSSVAAEPLTPIDRKEIEDLTLLFAQKYYTYTLENYTQVNASLLPVITPEYQATFEKITKNGFLAAQAAKAESKVESVRIIEVDKLSPNQGKVHFEFKAQVAANGQETENRYSTKLDLRKIEGHWKINAILSEQPVEFFNLQTLL